MRDRPTGGETAAVGPEVRAAALDWAARTDGDEAGVERLERQRNDDHSAETAALRALAGKVNRVGQNPKQAVRRLHAHGGTGELIERVEEVHDEWLQVKAVLLEIRGSGR